VLTLVDAAYPSVPEVEVERMKRFSRKPDFRTPSVVGERDALLAHAEEPA
jgi:hypothetical protein